MLQLSSFFTGRVIYFYSCEWIIFFIKECYYGLFKSCAVEFAVRGIRSNSVHPSMVNTDLKNEIEFF